MCALQGLRRGCHVECSNRDFLHHRVMEMVIRNLTKALLDLPSILLLIMEVKTLVFQMPKTRSCQGQQGKLETK